MSSTDEALDRKAMFDLVNMRPSAMRKLKADLEAPGYAELVLDSLVRHLVNAAPDGGADSDRLYTLGVKLTRADAWSRIDPAVVIDRADGLSIDTLLAFTAGMPDSIARNFQETHLRKRGASHPFVIKQTAFDRFLAWL